MLTDQVSFWDSLKVSLIETESSDFYIMTVSKQAEFAVTNQPTKLYEHRLILSMSHYFHQDSTFTDTYTVDMRYLETSKRLMKTIVL